MDSLKDAVKQASDALDGTVASVRSGLDSAISATASSALTGIAEATQTAKAALTEFDGYYSQAKVCRLSPGDGDTQRLWQTSACRSFGRTALVCICIVVCICEAISRSSASICIHLLYNVVIPCAEALCILEQVLQQPRLAQGIVPSCATPPSVQTRALFCQGPNRAHRAQFHVTAPRYRSAHNPGRFFTQPYPHLPPQGYVDVGTAHASAAHDAAFDALKHGIEYCATNPYIAYPVAATAALFALPPVRRRLYAATLGRFRTPESVAKAAAGRLEMLQSQATGVGAEATKLQARLTAAEEEYLRYAASPRNKTGFIAVAYPEGWLTVVLRERRKMPLQT